jgi:hypothetical protein
MDAKEFEKIPLKKRILKQQTLVVHGDAVRVLTMWDGVDTAHGQAPVPMPFSTFVASDHHPNMLMSYPDQEKAQMGHHLMIGFLRSQGCKSGLPVILHFIKGAFTNPRTIAQAWWMIVLFSIVVALQVSDVLASLVFGTWSWSDVFSAVIGAAYGYCLYRAAKKLKILRKERAEERRIEQDRKAFEEIVGPLSDSTD